MTHYFIRLLTFFLLWLTPISFYSWADEPSILAQHQVKELTLKNGLKVCLKPTVYEEESIVFQIFANGGYATFSLNDRPSAILAADIVWESGIGNQTGDQLSFDLYQNSIEMTTKIQPFDRQIEGTCPTESFELCLKTVNLVFTEPKFDKEAMKRSIAKSRQQIRIKERESELGSREAFLKVNTQNWDVLEPLTLTDLDYINLSKVEKFFRQAFSNPAEFVCVVVGDFNPDDIQPLIEKHLGSIPSTSSSNSYFKEASLPAFPSGITKKEMKGFHRYKQPLTRLTFPTLINIDETSTQSLYNVCVLLKSRLLPLFSDKQAITRKLEVSYEFPFFPKLDVAWITIQFSANPQEIDGLTKQILTSLEQLKKNGPTEQEFIDLKNDHREDDIEIEENTYLLSLISNYYRAHWNLEKLFQKYDMSKLEKNIVENELDRYLKLDQYSTVSLHP